MRFLLSALALLTPGMAIAGAEVELTTAVPVPEPATLAIMGAAVGGLVVIRKLRGPKR